MARDIQSLVEEQLTRWRLERQARERGERPSAPPERPSVVTLSNQYGSFGAEIGTRLAARLKVPLYEREVVAQMARSAHVHEETVDTLDQRARNRLDDYLTAIMHERNFDQGDYLRLLTRTIGALWEHGPCVIVGHGAVHIITRRHALAVRTVAAEELRVRRIGEVEGLSLEQARGRVRRIDAERASFHRRFFGADIDDPGSYDLVVNSTDLDLDACAAIIAQAFERKFAARGRVL
jgi:cytidylate kinase